MTASSFDNIAKVPFLIGTQVLSPHSKYVPENALSIILYCRNLVPASGVCANLGEEYPDFKWWLPQNTSGGEFMERKKATDYPQELLNLFDHYVHGEISRRNFLDGAKKYAVGGLTAMAIWESLRPNYA